MCFLLDRLGDAGTVALKARLRKEPAAVGLLSNPCADERSLGTPFGWLWAAYAVSAYGSGFGFGAMSIIAIRVLRAGPGQMSAAKIPFQAASGARLKALVKADDLLVANVRFESPPWSPLAVGPPLGGAAIGLFGAVASIMADAAGYLLSALGVRMLTITEPEPRRPEQSLPRFSELPDSRRFRSTLRVNTPTA
jgi:hypothetical protein